MLRKEEWQKNAHKSYTLFTFRTTWSRILGRVCPGHSNRNVARDYLDTKKPPPRTAGAKERQHALTPHGCVSNDHTIIVSHRGGKVNEKEELNAVWERITEGNRCAMLIVEHEISATEKNGSIAFKGSSKDGINMLTKLVTLFADTTDIPIDKLLMAIAVFATLQKNGEEEEDAEG